MRKRDVRDMGDMRDVRYYTETETETYLDDDLTLVSSLVRPLDVLQLESVGGAGRVVPHGEPVVPDDQGGPGGEGDGFPLLVNLHPEDGVLRGPEDAALHVDGGGAGGGDVWCDVGYCGRPLTGHNTKTQLLQSQHHALTEIITWRSRLLWRVSKSFWQLL